MQVVGAIACPNGPQELDTEVSSLCLQNEIEGFYAVYANTASCLCLFFMPTQLRASAFVYMPLLISGLTLAA